MAGGVESSKKIILLNRRSRVIELRLSGLSFRDIAAKIRIEFGNPKYGVSQAKRDTTAAIKPTIKEMGDNAQQVIALELLRLDSIQAAHWAHAVGNGGETAVSHDVSPKGYKESKDSRIAALNALLEHMHKIANNFTFDESNFILSEDGDPIIAGLDSLESVSKMIKNVVSELRVESQLPDSQKPDQGAAKIILDVMARRAKLLGLDLHKVELSGGIETTQADPLENMSEEDLSIVIANLEAAISASESGEIKQ